MPKIRKLQPGTNKIGPLLRFANLRADALADAEVPVGVVDLETRTVTFSSPARRRARCGSAMKS